MGDKIIVYGECNMNNGIAFASLARSMHATADIEPDMHDVPTFYSSLVKNTKQNTLS